jgi:hypothetical protein
VSRQIECKLRKFFSISYSGCDFYGLKGLTEINPVAMVNIVSASNTQLGTNPVISQSLSIGLLTEDEDKILKAKAEY